MDSSKIKNNNLKYLKTISLKDLKEGYHFYEPNTRVEYIQKGKLREPNR